MGYDSITNVSIQTAASNAKDFSKKKRVNRTAKLKQGKLDVRREQWLSQVKKKGFKQEISIGGDVKMASPVIHERNNDRQVMKLDIINPGGEENEGSMNHYSDDSDSPSNSPISHTSSILGISTSASKFSGSTRRSSSSSSVGCSSGSTTEEEEDDNGCLDDWEAIADALVADDTKNNNIDPNLEPHVHEPLVHLGSTPPKPVGQATRSQAWRPDDVFRPQFLPNLLKLNGFLPNSEGSYGQFGFKNLDSPPSNCPICCEDLDLTDSSFLPCPCGYRLCLFCHKRILEDDGRCPGCRKYYDHHGNASLKLGRSCNMPHRH